MKKVFEWLINNIFAVVDLLIVVGTALYAIVSKSVYLHIFSVLEIVLMVIIFVQFIIYVAILIRNMTSYKAYHYPWLKIRAHYDYLKKVVIYQRDENDILHFKREAEIKANGDVHMVLDKFIWTGKSEATIPMKGRNVQEIREQKERKGVWKFFDIVLNKQLRKGKTLDISYDWVPIKDCSTSSPFVSQSTEEPTAYLKFEIDLGAEYANKEIILEEYRAIDSNAPLNEIEGEKFDHNGRYVWEIKKPKRFRYYIARWEWNKTNRPDKE